MRLTTEQLLAIFGLDSNYLAAKSNKLDLSIVMDTIAPTTPRRVDEVVPVRTSVDHSEGESVKVEAAREGHGESNTTNSHASTTLQTSDTTRLVTPKRVKNDTVSAVRPARTDSTLVVAPIVRASIPVVTTTDVDPSLSRQVLPMDTVSYPVVVDSLAVDTVSLTEVKSMSSYSLDGQKKGIDLPIRLDSSDGVFALILVCFLLLAHVYNGGIAFFKENIMLVFSASKSEKLETQTTTKEIFYSYFLVFLAVLLISISLYEALDRFMPLAEGEKRPFVTIGMFIGLILFFILVKMMFNKLVGYIFDFDKRLNTWNRSYLVLLSILGLLCFLPTLILVYSSLWHSIIIGFVLVLFLIVQIILFLRIIVFFIGQKFNFLYLIAYLCTIEILPYIFLGIGLVYLYRIDIFNTIL